MFSIKTFNDPTNYHIRTHTIESFISYLLQFQANSPVKDADIMYSQKILRITSMERTFPIFFFWSFETKKEIYCKI